MSSGYIFHVATSTEYFKKENRNVAIYSRIAEPESEGDEFSGKGLNSKQRSMLKMMESKLKEETDAAQLQVALGLDPELLMDFEEQIEEPEPDPDTDVTELAGASA